MLFGELIKDLRIKQGKTLRNFCIEHNFDPGNHSKLERGVLPPPKDEGKLKVLALALGLKERNLDWSKFFDLAVVSNGHIPKYITDDKALLARLPAFFRTVKGEKIDDKKLDKLIELIREN